jgi:hypothetical protein
MAGTGPAMTAPEGRGECSKGQGLIIHPHQIQPLPPRAQRVVGSGKIGARCGGELPSSQCATAPDLRGEDVQIFSNSAPNTATRSRSAIRPSFAINSLPSHSEGAGNAGRPMRPIAACATIVVERTRVSQVTPESPGIPRAMVLRLIRALLGDLCLVATVVRGTCPATLAPASERQDHTTSPSASGSPVKRAARVHRIPLRVS